MSRVLTRVAGGVDFMNADASVMLQETTVLAAVTPGALVGTRLTGRNEFGGALRWEPGITIDGMGVRDPNTPEILNADYIATLSLGERADLIAATRTHWCLIVSGK